MVERLIGGKPLGRRLSPEEAASQAAEHEARVAACTHEIHLRNVGFGFGQLDYFCIHCEHLVKSVPLADMTNEEKTRVGVLVGHYFSSEGI
jgi:hypothetical protein